MNAKAAFARHAADLDEAVKALTTRAPATLVSLLSKFGRGDGESTNETREAS